MNAKDAWLKQVEHHRRRLKGLPRVGFNPNAGNVEHNIDMFNKMYSGDAISVNPISGPFGGDISAPAGDGAGMAMGESLTEALKTNKAYMLRKDGKVFELIGAHPYIIPNSSMFIDSAVYELINYRSDELIWFYNNCVQDRVKDYIHGFIIQCYKFQTYYRLDNHKILELADLFNVDLSDWDISETPQRDEQFESLFRNLNNATNQEFCRFRTSDLFRSNTSSSRDIYFRISSMHFNWFDNIWQVVYENKSWINSVTIESDYQSKDIAFIYKHGSETFDHMPVDDFISISGNPIIECFEHNHLSAVKLREGKSYFEALSGFNIVTMDDVYHRLYEDYFTHNFKLKKLSENYKQTYVDLSPELKLFIEECIEYIEHNQFTDVYEMLSSDIGTADELTDVLFSAGIDPMPYFDRYLPSHFASGLNITEVEIPGNIYMIQPYAFYGCPLLSKIDISDGVEYIGEEAFCDCYNLTEVNLPRSLLEISRGAFSDCWQLKDVYYHGTKEEFDKVKLPYISSINKKSDFKSIHCIDGEYYLDPY